MKQPQSTAPARRSLGGSSMFSGIGVGGGRTYLDPDAEGGVTTAPAAGAPGTQQATGPAAGETQGALAQQIAAAVVAATAPLQSQLQALNDAEVQRQGQIAGLTTPARPGAAQMLKGSAPAIRQGEDPLTSRGYSFARMMQQLTPNLANPGESKVERDISQRLRAIYGTSGEGSGGFLVPLASEHIQGFDGRLARECQQLVAAGVDNVDADRVRQAISRSGVHQQLMQQGIDIYDDTQLGVFLGPTQQGELITLLRNREAITQAGAQEITMPANGRLSWPRETGDVTAYWVGQGTATRSITGSTPTTGSLLMAVKKLAALVLVPNDFLRLATTVNETYIRSSIVAKMALELDSSLLSATGSQMQPKGLINYSGINTVVASVIGANGNVAEPQDIDAMVATVEEENIDTTNFRFLMRPKMHSALRTRRASAVSSGDEQGPFVFGDVAVNAAMGNRNTLHGFDVIKTAQVPNNRAKGSATNLSTIIGGAFENYVIGRHGVLELGASSEGLTLMTDDNTVVRAIQYVDGIPLREEAFVQMDSLIVG